MSAQQFAGLEKFGCAFLRSYRGSLPKTTESISASANNRFSRLFSFSRSFSLTQVRTDLFGLLFLSLWH